MPVRPARHPAAPADPRSRVAALLISAVVAVVLACAGAAPAQAEPHASYRSEALPSGSTSAVAARASSGSRASASGRRVTTIRLSPRKRFSLVALRWRSSRAEVEGQLRARLKGGRWTEWMDLQTYGHEGEGDGPDRAEDRRADRRTRTNGSTEPIWTGPATKLQIRLTSRRPKGLRASFVDVSGARPQASGARSRARRAVVVPNTAGIHTREEWDPGNSCAPRSRPATGEVKAVIVHHTVNPNGYSAAQVPAMLLAICKYHRNGQGWNDIGYNYLVDRFGTAWEGRAGGITLPVIGAHAQGFNAQTAGISMLGDNSSAPPTPEQLATVARVAAWRLAVAGQPRAGTVQLESAGGPASRFSAGKDVTIERVSGHRDVGLTSCPGDAGYATLGSIRASVAAASPQIPPNLPAVPITSLPASTGPEADVSISVQRRVDIGRTTVARGAVRARGGDRIANTRVQLQVAVGDGWMTVATGKTDSKGRYRLKRKLTRTWQVRVRRPDGTGGISVTKKVTLVPKLTLSVPRRMVAGRDVTLRGTIAPGRGPVYLDVAKRGSDGRYRSGDQIPVTLKGRKASITITPHSRTLYRFRLVYKGSRLQGPRRSSAEYGRVVSASSVAGGASAR